jgi:hypothetical protein
MTPGVRPHLFRATVVELVGHGRIPFRRDLDVAGVQSAHTYPFVWIVPPIPPPGRGMMT